jgi:dTDP-4-amino-4,6-dideoxygalactose transaminase/predicted GNAT family acetyltransferase
MKYPLFKVFMSDKVDEYVVPVLKSGMITQGKQVELFEEELRKFFDYPYILTLNSATSGLTLAIRLLNLTPDDEIITTALTCTATNWPILANGVNIKWADVDERNCNISIESIREKISEKTKAIMIVHWGGYPVDLEALQEIVKEAENKYGNKITVIQDCAHAFGAKYKNRHLGTHRETENDRGECKETQSISVYSLQAIKHLNTGDGGLIFLPNKEMYERAKLLRWFGIDREKRTPPGGDIRMESDIAEWGYKFHMNDIAASIGRANIVHVLDNIKKLQENNKYYKKYLSNLENVELLHEDDYSESACWLFTIKVSDKKSFIDFMTRKEIMVSQVHNRNDNHSCVSSFKCDLPNLDSLEKRIVCIPSGWWLTDEDKKFILDSVKEWNDAYTLTLSTCDSQFRELLPSDFYNGYLELMKQFNGFDYPDRIKTLEQFEQRLDCITKQGAKIYVKEIDGNIVCTCKVLLEEKFGDSILHIEDVCVHENYRNKGMGKKMIEHVVSQYAHADVYKIILNCSDNLESFYKKCGFVNKGVQMKYEL